MLHLFGTKHDERSWQSPEKFLPERFFAGEPGLFAFVPQGGGTIENNHRCPGEAITGALMAQAVAAPRPPRRHVAAQYLPVDDRRLPALPREQFLLRRVRWVD